MKGNKVRLHCCALLGTLSIMVMSYFIVKEVFYFVRAGHQIEAEYKDAKINVN